MFVVHGDQSDLCLVLPQKPTRSTQSVFVVRKCALDPKVETGFESALTERKLQSGNYRVESQLTGILPTKVTLLIIPQKSGA